MANLKPCPFCGGEARLYRGKGSRNGVPMYFVSICCKRCGASTKSHMDGKFDVLDEESPAVYVVMERWNQRASRKR